MIIKTDKTAIANYFEDASGLRGAWANFIAIAQNIDEIPQFLLDKAKEKTPLTVCAGLTANTGAGLAFGGGVLSLELLDKIGEIKGNDKPYIEVEAGARLADIKNYLAKQGLMYPPDPTEQNSKIGGNIATNASGARGFKFGPTRKYIKSIDIAFTDGSIAKIERRKYFADDAGNISFETSKGIKSIRLPKYDLPKIKNSAGYYNYKNADLIDIFIGSEGTLGVILKAELFVVKKYKNIYSGIVFFDDDDALFAFVEDVKNKAFGIEAMALEYFDKNTIDFIRDEHWNLPICAGAIMFEQDIYDGQDESEILEKWTNLIEKYGIDLDKVWFADDDRQTQKLRDFRHSIPEKSNEVVHKTGIRKVGTDFAVGDGHIREIIKFCHSEFDKCNALNFIFGHIGENHLHANILAKNESEFIKIRKVYEDIIKKAVSLGGTVSAEHGIGKIRHVFLEDMLGEAALKEMAEFKKSLDPACILGIDNIFPKKFLGLK
jgi:D-lactate dehydrogenase (cytochrome)